MGARIAVRGLFLLFAMRAFTNACALQHGARAVSLTLCASSRMAWNCLGATTRIAPRLVISRNACAVRHELCSVALFSELSSPRGICAIS
jgi:hypothetical protein